jgi:hypothetical protein
MTVGQFGSLQTGDKVSLQGNTLTVKVMRNETAPDYMGRYPKRIHNVYLTVDATKERLPIVFNLCEPLSGSQVAAIGRLEPFERASPPTTQHSKQ